MEAKREQWSPLPGEKVVHQTQPYTKDKIKWYLYLAIPTVGITLIAALYTWLYFRLIDIQLILTNRRFVIASGWLARRASTIELEKVQEVTTEQRLLSDSCTTP